MLRKAHLELPLRDEHALVQRHGLQGPVGVQQRDGAGALVDLAALESDQPVLDHVDAAHAVFAGNTDDLQKSNYSSP